MHARTAAISSTAVAIVCHHVLHLAQTPMFPSPTAGNRLACPHLEPRTTRRAEAFGLGGPWGHHRASARDGHEIGVVVPRKPHGHLKMAFTLLQKVFAI
jgi:hypothetical protein